MILGVNDMGKALAEMTLEELWELFPIFLVEQKDILLTDLRIKYIIYTFVLQGIIMNCILGII